MENKNKIKGKTDTPLNAQFTSGCPNQCSYCHEPKEMKFFNPEIPESKDVDILDMNILANPNHLEILRCFNKM